jgi:hypothetical protein
MINIKIPDFKMMILSKEKESPFTYNPRLDNYNNEILFKDKVERAKKFLIGKGMTVENQDTILHKKASE